MQDAVGACRGGVPLAAGPLSRGRAGLRRHLPRPARRHRPQLGGPLHHDRRPRAAGASKREPDVVIGTDAETWLQLREGEISGVEAF